MRCSSRPRRAHRWTVSAGRSGCGRSATGRRESRPAPPAHGGNVVDGWLIFFRIVHVGSAMIWFGGAIIGGFFLSPTAAALGDSAQPFMDHLMRRRRMGILFPVVAALTVVAGAALYWR